MISLSDPVSPTAHYTGYVWARNGLSHPELATIEGRLLFESLRPVMTASAAVGGASLENYLLARHLAIDTLLERAIERDGVSQVIEVAAGLSPRGWRFAQRYGEELTYIEADLPEMAARKRRALEKMDALGEHHRVSEVDALREEGPGSLPALAAELAPEAGVAIITEGLLGYLPGEDVRAIWRRFAAVLGGFITGRYISDLHLGSVQNMQVRAFRVLLSAFVRGRVHLHFSEARDARSALKEAGFAHVQIRRAVDMTRSGEKPGSAMAHVFEASTE